MDDDLVREFDRLKDEYSGVVCKMQNIELKVTALEERDAHREETFTSLKDEFKEAFAKFEGMLTSLATQVSLLASAGPKRAERRLEDISKVVRDWLIIAALGFVVYKIFGKITP
jgi:predicted nuclease with TOPRIM domain